MRDSEPSTARHPRTQCPETHNETAKEEADCAHSGDRGTLNSRRWGRKIATSHAHTLQLDSRTRTRRSGDKTTNPSCRSHPRHPQAQSRTHNQTVTGRLAAMPLIRPSQTSPCAPIRRANSQTTLAQLEDRADGVPHTTATPHTRSFVPAPDTLSRHTTSNRQRSPPQPQRPPRNANRGGETAHQTSRNRHHSLRRLREGNSSPRCRRHELPNKDGPLTGGDRSRKGDCSVRVRHGLAIRVDKHHHLARERACRQVHIVRTLPIVSSVRDERRERTSKRCGVS